MKNKLLSVIAAMSLAVTSFASLAVTASAAGSVWKEASPGDIKDGDTVVVTVTTGNGSVYGLPHVAASGAPAAAKLAVSTAGDELTAGADDCTWTVSRDGDTFTFTSPVDNESVLYCNNTNNGVRVGTSSDSSFTIAGGYLYNSGTSRYLGVYNGQDWRCYTSVNDNIKGQTLQFWKASEPAPPVSAKEASLDDIKDGDTVVFTVTTSNGSVYGLPHTASTSAPTAAKLAILSASGELIDGNAAVGDCTWTVSRDGDTLTFTSPAATESMLYCNNTNNGVRLGAGSNNSFTVSGGYLYNSDTNRYLGVYNGQDWRCYTTIHDNIKGQTLRFWKLGTPTAAVYAKKASLSDIRDGDTVIFTMKTSSDSVYGLPHSATENAPAAAELDVSSAGDRLIDGTAAAVADCTWTVSRNGDTLTFTSPDDNKSKLYCNNTNNGVRVGAGSNSSFTVSGGYLYNSDTSRYLGVYNDQDWRCYTTIHDNIKGQDLQFWKLIEPATATYSQVGDDYDAEFSGDTQASLWRVSVTPGGDAITTLSVEVNGIQPEKPLKSDTAFSGAGGILFGVVLNGIAADVKSFMAIVNGEAVATTAE